MDLSSYTWIVVLGGIFAFTEAFGIGRLDLRIADDDL
jgi:hypothetical protein